MLFKAALGETTYDHPELQSFCSGYLLHCRNDWTLAHVRSPF